MAKNFRLEIHEGALNDLLDDAGIRGKIEDVAKQVRDEAAATAQAAESSRKPGYASAGFGVEWDERDKRPRINIVSNASGDVALAAHFKTQRQNGVGHLRAALYKYTERG